MNTDNPFGSYDPKFRLLHELVTKNEQLDFAIRQAELQLRNVNKKLDSLWYDLKLFSVLFVIELLVGKFLTWFTSDVSPVNAGVAVMFVLFKFLSLLYQCFVMRFVMPLTFALAVLSLSQIIENRDRELSFDPPPLEGELNGELPNREKNYRTEQKKLIYILTRYYIGQDTIKQLRKQVELEPESITLAELKHRLEQIPIYEPIRSANPNFQNKK